MFRTVFMTAAILAAFTAETSAVALGRTATEPAISDEWAQVYAEGESTNDPPTTDTETETYEMLPEKFKNPIFSSVVKKQKEAIKDPTRKDVAGRRKGYDSEWLFHPDVKTKTIKKPAVPKIVVPKPVDPISPKPVDPTPPTPKPEPTPEPTPPGPTPLFGPGPLPPIEKKNLKRANTLDVGKTVFPDDKDGEQKPELKRNNLRRQNGFRDDDEEIVYPKEPKKREEHKDIKKVQQVDLKHVVSNVNEFTKEDMENWSKKERLDYMNKKPEERKQFMNIITEEDQKKRAAEKLALENKK